MSIGFQYFAASMTGSFIPTIKGSALALPTLLLFDQPSIGSLFLQRLEIRDDIQMMDAAIVLESPNLIAWKFVAKTTVQNFFTFRTRSNTAFCTSRMDVQDVRSATCTCESLRRFSLAACFLEEMLAFRKSGTIVVACTAVETAHPKKKSGIRHSLLVLFTIQECWSTSESFY
jgi:hypothetical protein